MDKKNVKFGILGAGVIASFHADAINSLDNATLVGVYDKNSDGARSFSEKYNIKAYESYESMLFDDGIDAVCICTPSGFHAQQAIKALEYKKHVVLEKPMAFSGEDADKVAKAREESGKLLTVVSQLRFSDDIQKIRKLIAEGAFGEISLCDLYMKYWRSEQYYAQSTWRGTKALDGGGALMNQGIHGVDLLLYIAGDAKLLSAKCKTKYHDIEVEDTAVAFLEFENGAMGVIEASTCAYPGFERRLEIIGSKGCVILRENTIEKLICNGEVLIDKKADSSAANTASDPTAMSCELHARQIKNFISAIFGEEKLLIDEKDGKKAVKMIEDIYNFSF